MNAREGEAGRPAYPAEPFAGCGSAGASLPRANAPLSCLTSFCLIASPSLLAHDSLLFTQHSVLSTHYSLDRYRCSAENILDNGLGGVASAPLPEVLSQHAVR